MNAPTCEHGQAPCPETGSSESAAYSNQAAPQQVAWRPAFATVQQQELARASALPAEFYTHCDSLNWEQAVLFPVHWQLLAHEEQLAQAGDHVVAEIAGQPLVLVRDQQSQLRALHNVCRHRAGPLALCSGRGAKALRCRYHGWVYDLAGELRATPEMAGAEDFEHAKIRLPQSAVGCWSGLVFAALKPTHDLSELLGPVSERLARADAARDWSDYRFYRRISYEVACNWKVYVENFLEGYHLPLVHPGLSQLLDYRAYRTELGPWHSLQWSPLESVTDDERIASDQTDGAGPGQNQNFYGNGDALYFFLFPNIMLNILPGRLQTNQVVPLGVDRCRVDFDYYYPNAGFDEQRVLLDQDFSDEVQQEDIAICEAVQRGLASGSYTPGRLSPQRESGVYHFHELLRRAWRQSLGMESGL